MVPPPPTLLVTTTFSIHLFSCQMRCIRRAILSLVAPGAETTTISTARSGFHAGCAPHGAVHNMARAAARHTVARMDLSLITHHSSRITHHAFLRTRARSIAAHSLDGVNGMSRWLMPSGRSASMAALTSAGNEPLQPDSPTPFAPSALVGVGTG